MSAFWTDAYQRHFQHYFNKPFDIQVYHDAGGASLKLATYDWAMPGFRVYASIGLADRLLEQEANDVGEVILYSDIADKEVPLLFVNALFFILAHDIPMSKPFAVGFAAVNRAFARRFDKNALYFTRPFDPDGQFGRIWRGENFGRVFQAFFIAPQEDEFLENEGAESFHEKFTMQFGDELPEEERLELAVDKARSSELSARLQQAWQRAAPLFSVRRPSCI